MAPVACASRQARRCASAAPLLAARAACLDLLVVQAARRHAPDAAQRAHPCWWRWQQVQRVTVVGQRAQPRCVREHVGVRQERPQRAAVVCAALRAMRGGHHNLVPRPRECARTGCRRCLRLTDRRMRLGSRRGATSGLPHMTRVYSYHLSLGRMY